MSSSARWTGVLVLLVGLLALAVRLALVLRAAGMAGIDGYDGGVYYAASTSLLWGRVPYQDFVLLHPPGIMLLLAPFAVLGRLTHDSTGFEAARGVSLLAGAVNAALVVVVARRARAGATAAVVAGALYAVWTPAAVAETTIRLEPWVTLGLLGALAGLLGPGGRPSRRRLLVAGCCLAFAFSVKIWAVAPAAYLAAWCWRRWDARALLPLAAGAGVAVAALDLPFFLAAPAPMWRMVVLDQLGRGRTELTVPQRLVVTLLDGRTVDLQSAGGHAAVAGLVAACCLLVAAGVRTPLGRLVTGLLGLQLAVLALSPSFYSYYPAFAAPAVVLLVGAAAGTASRGLRRAPVPGLRRAGRTATAGVALAAVVMALLLVARVDSRVTVRRPFPATVVASAAAGARCVTSDSPDALLLTDLYSRDLARGCPAPVDLSGLRYDVDALPLRPDGRAHPRAHNRRWQHSLVRYLRDGQMIFVMRAADDGVSRLLRHRVLALPAVASGHGYRLFDNDAVRRRTASGQPGRAGRPAGSAQRGA